MTQPSRSNRDENAPSGLIGRLSAIFFGEASRSKQAAANRGWIITLGLTAIIGLGLIFAVSIPNLQRFAASALVAVAAAMAGSLLGFLFGLPRARRVAADGEAEGMVEGGDNVAVYQPNTNLDDISDWLTKILVGVGLTQIGTIPDQFQRLVDFTRAAVGAGQDSHAITSAILVSYSVIGFMGTYLWARTRAATAFRLADEIQRERRLELVETQVEAIVAGTIAPQSTKVQQGTQPPPPQLP